MRGAILCEYSGVVRDAFIALGHDVISCDLLPTERPGPHYQGDVFEFLEQYPDGYFDFAVTHAPCTRLCNSGVLRLYIGGKKENGIDPVKWQEMIEGANFFKKLLFTKKAKTVYGENPVMHGYALHIIGMKQMQTIQPYNFNEDASKRTGLWIINGPKIENTGFFPPRMVCPDCGKNYVYKQTDFCDCGSGRLLLPRWSNQTDSGQNRLAPSETREARTAQRLIRASLMRWPIRSQDILPNSKLIFNFYGIDKNSPQTKESF